MLNLKKGNLIFIYLTNLIIETHCKTLATHTQYVPEQYVLIIVTTRNCVQTSLTILMKKLVFIKAALQVTLEGSYLKDIFHGL